MKIIAFLFLTIFCSSVYENETLLSGKYDELNLAFNPKTNKITGYFQSSTGYDENTDQPKFSCIFYLEGTLSNNTASIKTYYPLSKQDDLITGSFTLLANSQVSLKLPEDHGGCWNVQPFSKDAVNFQLSEKQNWIEIRYVVIDKSYFYSQKNESDKRHAYIVKGDVVYIERIEENWAYCHFYGKNITSGWIKIESLNTL